MSARHLQAIPAGDVGKHAQLALDNASSSLAQLEGEKSVGEAATRKASSNASVKKGKLVEKESYLAIAQESESTASEEQTMMARFDSRIQQQLEYTFSFHRAPTQSHSKTSLAVVSILGFGIFGVDRCVMGQYITGIIKGVTIGGFGFWAAIDYIVITINCLARWDSIDAVGYKAKFSGDIESAFWVTLICFIMKCCCGGARAKARKDGSGKGPTSAFAMEST